MYHSKKEEKEQFGKEVSQDVSGNRKLFCKDVFGKVKCGEVE